MLLNRCFTLTLSLALGLLMNTAYAQTCQSNIKDKWPNSRYTDHNNGTVTDNTTGLMWMQCSQGQTSANNTCNGTTQRYNWKAALERASQSTFADHSDWRLPNIKELASLVADNCYNPSINQTLFPNTPDSFFSSSTPSAEDISQVKTISFSYGGYDYNGSRYGSFRARFVRSGQ